MSRGYGSTGAPVVSVLFAALSRLVRPRTTLPLAAWVVVVLSLGVLAESVLRAVGPERWRGVLPAELPLAVSDLLSLPVVALALVVCFTVVTPLTLLTLTRLDEPTSWAVLSRAPAFLGAWVVFSVTVAAGTVLFVLPGLLVGSIWLLWMPVVAVEGKSPVTGLRRGWRLARDRRLALLGTVWLAVPVGSVLAAPFVAGALVLAARRPLLAHLIGSFGLALAVCYGFAVVTVWYERLAPAHSVGAT